MTQTNSRLNFPDQWNLQLLYESPDDPQLQQDLKDYNIKRKAFAEKYKNQTEYLEDENQLLLVLTEYEQLLEELNGARPLMYFHYLTEIESHNQQAQAQLNKITTELTKAQNHLTFFPIKLGKIDQALQDKFLQSTKLERYHYLLKRRFELAKFDLKEDQEKIINLTDQTSHQMWVKGVEKSLNGKTVSFRGKKLPLSEVSQKIAELPTDQRQQLHKKVLTKASEIIDFAETELNAIVTYKQMEDELRGYKTPDEATIVGSENSLETVHNLVDLVTKNFDLAHRFYQLKAKLLKLDKLTYADRAAKIDGFDQQYDFQQSYDLIHEAFTALDPEFAQILERMSLNGQLDIYPRQGKVSGAFCSSSTNNPTYVLLNHINNFNSVTTFAHEMGHAIHSELSKKQPVIYQHYSTSTAETASTFFEQFAFEKLIENFSKSEKIIALHNRLQDDINTIFRQIALFNFENELHQQIKEVGYLAKDQIGDLLNRHTQAYLGPLFELTPLDGNFFILWGHIRYFFYTYTYAYGHLISKAMVKGVKQDPKFISQIKQFLSAGGNNTPAKIFKQIGIDITQPDFFKQGLDEIEQEINQLEKLLS